MTKKHITIKKLAGILLLYLDRNPEEAKKSSYSDGILLAGLADSEAYSLKP
jgi:hypothetical protein